MAAHAREAVPRGTIFGPGELILLFEAAPGLRRARWRSSSCLGLGDYFLLVALVRPCSDSAALHLRLWRSAKDRFLCCHRLFVDAV